MIFFEFCCNRFCALPRHACYLCEQIIQYHFILYQCRVLVLKKSLILLRSCLYLLPFCHHITGSTIISQF